MWDSFTNGRWLTYTDPVLAREIESLPWVEDGLNDAESVAIRELVYVAPRSLAIASSIVDLAWVQDGIATSEANTIWTFSTLAWKDAGLASSVIGFDWVQDGIDQIEYKALDELRYFNLDDLRALSSVIEFAWVQDGIDETEAEVVDALNAFTDVDLTLRILSMPFLETLEPVDASAVQSLGSMQTKDNAILQRVLSHPTFSDGITDEWAPVVATLHGLIETNPQLIDTLLDPDKVTLEQRVVTLPLAGETLLAIIRSAPGSEQTMDLLEYATLYAEDYMQTSFPTGYVGWLFADGTTDGSLASTTEPISQARSDTTLNTKAKLLLLDTSWPMKSPTSIGTLTPHG